MTVADARDFAIDVRAISWSRSAGPPGSFLVSLKNLLIQIDLCSDRV
jgi:hypothetical protein